MRPSLLAGILLCSICIGFTPVAFAQTSRNIPDSLLAELRKERRDTSYIRTANRYAWWLIHSLDRPHSADSLLHKAEPLAKKLKDWDGLERTYLNIGRAKMRNAGYLEALKYAQTALQISKKHKVTPAAQQLIFSRIGQCYFYTNQLDASLKYFLAATKLTEKYHLTEGSTRAYIGISEVLRATNRRPEAITYAQKAIKAGEVDTDKTAFVWSRLLMSNFLSEDGQAEQAMAHLLKAVPVANRYSNVTQRVSLWNMLANHYMDTDQSDSAYHYLEMMEDRLTVNSNPGIEMSTYGAFGRFYQLSGKAKLSEEYYKKGLQSAVKTNYFFGQMSPLMHLTQLYSQTNQFKKAFEYQVELDKVKDSIYSNQLASKTRDLITKYESQKKEDQIRLLNQQRENDRFQRNAMLVGVVLLAALAVVLIAWLINRAKVMQMKQAQRLRQQIADDLHDEVGSTLNSISLLSGVADQLLNQNPLVAGYGQTNDRPENNYDPAQKIVRKIYTDTRQILESVDEIIWTIHPSDSTSATIAQKLRDYALPLMESKNITCHFHTDPSTEQPSLSMDVRRNMYLIGKEAVNNLVKHSRATEADIHFFVRQKQLRLTVTDNGIGFDTNANSTRNGRKSMQQRAATIGAVLDIRSRPGMGTTIDTSLNLR